MSNIVKEIIFVSGISSTLVGLNVNGYELKCSASVPLPENDDYLSPTKRVFDLGNPYFGVGSILGQGFSYSFTDDSGLEYFLYFQKEVDFDCADTYFETQHLINCLRLFQNSRIGFFCPLSVKPAGGCVVFPDVYHTFHSVWTGEVEDFNCATDSAQLNKFYSDTFKHKYSNIVAKMLHLYHDSFRMHSIELKLIQRTTVLEMLIEGNAELTNRLSRSVAVFLGKDLDESRRIYNRMKQIYSARSKYLYEGNKEKISSHIAFDALDFSRRIIANLMYINCEEKEFRDRIDEAGFGSNPLDVKI